MENDYTRHLWLKETALAFGMTVTQFAEAIGYKRQTIYSAVCGSAKLHKGHLSMAAHKLMTLSDKILEQDIQSAKDRHATRRKLIDNFLTRLTERYEDGN